MPITNVNDLQYSSILDNINESVIVKPNNPNNLNFLNINRSLIDDSAIYETQKSLNSNPMNIPIQDNISESRKVKNVIDAYQNSLPPILFKKREFIVEKNKSNIEENTYKGTQNKIRL